MGDPVSIYLFSLFLSIYLILLMKIIRGVLIYE